MAPSSKKDEARVQFKTSGLGGRVHKRLRAFAMPRRGRNVSDEDASSRR
jgi:hypothetical protein